MEYREKEIEQKKKFPVKHTFAVCAYQDSPYLEACFSSLREQSIKTDIICCTSTPSEYIINLTNEYQIPLYIRDGKSNIREDWLFAWEKAEGELVTIAHQDDRYGKNYVKTVLESYQKYQDMTVFMSDYVTLKTNFIKERNEIQTKMERYNKVWLVKKVLRLPLRFYFLTDRRFVKRSALMFGNSVCCPSCTYNKRLIRGELFQSKFDFALDWDNLYELAGQEGRFICSERPLLAYRVHEGATTKACIKDHRRMTDEIAMFEKMWPKPMVRFLMHYYKKAYQEYES